MRTTNIALKPTLVSQELESPLDGQGQLHQRTTQSKAQGQILY
jgi:hypothetical protein